MSKKTKIAFMLGTYEDWGGASRALLNFIRTVDVKRFTPLVVLTQEGDLSAKLSSEGIDWTTWGKHDRSKNVAKYLINIVQAAIFFRKHRVDVVHINYSSIGWKPAEILAARALGIPIINHLHCAVRQPSSYLRYSAAVVGVSNYVVRATNTFGARTVSIHNISYLARFAHGRNIREEIGILPNQVMILYMGQMIRAKGIEELISAFAEVHNADARLVLAGAIRETAGAYTLAEVEAMVKTDTRAKYIGFRTDAENLYASTDFLVMPSQWDEPCAMVLFEGAAAGKPIVATATGGTPEVLRHGETGLLVDRADTKALTDAIRTMADDPSLRARMGECARQLAANTFATRPIELMEHLYDSVTFDRKRSHRVTPSAADEHRAG